MLPAIPQAIGHLNQPYWITRRLSTICANLAMYNIVDSSIATMPGVISNVSPDAAARQRGRSVVTVIDEQEQQGDIALMLFDSSDAPTTAIFSDFAGLSLTRANAHK